MGAFGSTRRALLAGVAVSLLAVACGSTTTTSSGADVGQGQLTGAGSTFDNPLFSKAFFDYNQRYPNVTVNYQSVGSGAGIQQFIQKTVDFGATDVPMASADITSAGGADTLTQIPITLGVVAIAYNVNGLSSLNLDGATLAGIFLGKITRWDDPAIAALNPGAKLPGAAIVPVHRADSSGSTFLFTSYLNAQDPSGWNSSLIGTTVAWPRRPGALGVTGSDAIISSVKSAPGAIGYVGVSYLSQVINATEGEAALGNSAGSFVLPTARAIQAALASFTNTPASETISLVNGSAAQAYPIVNYEYAVVNTSQPSATRAQDLRAFLTWAVTSGREQLGQVNFQPLPSSIVTLSDAQIAKIEG